MDISSLRNACRRGWLIGGGLWLLSGCGQTSGDSSEAPQVARRLVVIETLTAVELKSGFQTSGIVEADIHIDLAFRVGGFVEQLHVEEGDRVEMGQPLVELDLRDLRRQLDLDTARLNRTKAKLDETQSEFERQVRLLRKNQTSEQEHQRAQSRLAVAQAELDEAKVQLAIAQDRLSDAVLRSPIDGHVQSRQIELHEYVQPRVPVLGLVAMERVKIRATVPDRYAHLLMRGGPAEVWVNNDTSQVYPGAISLIGVTADRETRSIPFEVTVDNSALLLKPDTVASVRIAAATSQLGVLVPVNAVLRDIGLQPFCFIVTQTAGESVVERRAIVLAGLYQDRIGVSEGLAAGDKLVVQGQHFLASGDPVEVRREPFDG